MIRAIVLRTRIFVRDVSAAPSEPRSEEALHKIARVEENRCREIEPELIAMVSRVVDASQTIESEIERHRGVRARTTAEPEPAHEIIRCRAATDNRDEKVCLQTPRPVASALDGWRWWRCCQAQLRWGSRGLGRHGVVRRFFRRRCGGRWSCSRWRRNTEPVPGGAPGLGGSYSRCQQHPSAHKRAPHPLHCRNLRVGF